MPYLVNSAFRIYGETFNQTTFDQTWGPFALDHGLPFLRSFCYGASLLLAARKAMQGIAALGLKIIPGAEDCRKRANDAFRRNCIRDLAIIVGLMGSGLLIEGLESDLNLYFQEKEIRKKFLSQLINAESLKEFYSKLCAACQDLVAANRTNHTTTELVVRNEVPQNKILDLFFLMIKTANYSMKRMRLTPLETHSYLELQYGIPLSRMGFGKVSEPSILSELYTFLEKRFVLFKDCYQQEGCLSAKAEEKFRALSNFLEDPHARVVDYLSTSINRTKTALMHTQTFKAYQFVSQLWG